jgi:Tol biopolymer transport system component
VEDVISVHFDFSSAPSGHGSLVYLEGKGVFDSYPVMWLDSSGKVQPLISTMGAYWNPRFSPDGKRLAIQNGPESDIYVYDVSRETMTRITSGGYTDAPIWTPDGKHIAYFQSAGGRFGIFWIRSDGSGEPQQLLATQNISPPWSFSPDGRRLAYFGPSPGAGFDIWTLPLDASDPDRPKAGNPEPFLRTPASEYLPMFSPDGRWLMYRSNESGKYEIYVRPFPPGRSGKWQISTGGALLGIWANNGRELYYENADNHIMVVDYAVKSDSFVPAKPRLWSETRLFTKRANMALAPDGKRFAVFPMPEDWGSKRGTVHVIFLENFLDEMRRRIPHGP